MFTTIFRHEITHWYRQPLPYIFGFFLFALALLTMWGMASEGASGPNAEMMNSYFRINFMTNYLSMFMLFILPAIIGVSVYRDYKSRMYTLLYSYPIQKAEYLLAKFCSSFLVAILVVSMLGLGFMLGTLMPGVNTDILLPFDLGAYTQLYAFYLIPNVFLFGIIVFAVVVFTRNIYVGFISIILVVILQGIFGGILTSVDLRYLAAMLDPIGDTAVKYMVKYWTLEERNTQALPVSGVILVNRLLWLGITILIAGITYWKFQFNQFVAGASQKKDTHIADQLPIFSRVVNISLPKVHFDFSFFQRLKTSWQLSDVDFRYIVFSWPFVAILLSGFLLVYFQQAQMNPPYGFQLLPTTARMLRVPMFIFTLVINLLTFLYMGVLIYRGKTTRMHALIDVVPQPDWVLLLSQLLAVLKVQFLLLTLVIVGGMLAQTINGYYRYEIGHYIFELYGLQFIHFAIWACIALFIHTLFKNMYLGFFILLLIPMGTGMLPQVGAQLGLDFLKESILQFNRVPGINLGFDYSDLNGYGSILPLYFAYKIYWLVAAIGLMLGAILLWKRGFTYTFKERWQLAKIRFTRPLKLVFFLTLIVFVGMGSSLYYQEHYVSKTNFTQEDQDRGFARNEKQYGHFQSTLQPKITKAKIDMQLFPDTRDFKANGTLYFVNKVDHIIDTILVATSFKEVTSYTINTPHHVLIQDEALHFDVIKLDKGLQLGDTLALNFAITNHPNSLLHNNSRVLSNGTYLDARILPTLGFRNAFLTSKKKRTAYGLGDRKVKDHLPTDTALLGYQFAYNNMDRIDYETVVSTASDQMAFSMGDLQNSWTEGGRNYFHYQSAGKITNNISWLSGRYVVEKDSTAGLSIEVYHHPDHNQNIGHLLGGLKASIDYCSSWFGALDYETLRLIEFPITTGTHATLNGNLIPYSESLFLCDIDDAKNEVFNFPFYTSAHEVAHYWWGHRVDPANVQGGKMLTESIAEYIALQVMKQHYGKEKATKFLATSREIYLRQRATAGDEHPLNMAREDQDYINYRKGLLVFNALSEYIGEAQLNMVLAKYEKARRYSLPPYPTSLDFLDTLAAAIPDSLQYLMRDMFETITLYDNAIKEVNIQDLKNGQYQVDLSFSISKYRSNAAGKKSYGEDASVMLTAGALESLPLKDYIRIGLFRNNDSDDQEIEIGIEEIKVSQIDNRITLIVDQKPNKVVIDPNFLLIDGDRRDDVWSER